LHNFQLILKAHIDFRLFFDYFNIMENLHEPISVISVFDAKKRSFKPLKIKWNNREYIITEITSHLTDKVKGILHHTWTIMCGDTFMEIHLNTQNLFWTIERVGSYGF
jgi:hypothetical protein